MALNLVQFKTTDKLLLPGLFYEPSKKTEKVAIYLHGLSGSAFRSSERTNAFGAELNKKGISFLAFDNRGADIIKKVVSINSSDEPYIGGATYEVIKECISDIDGAVAYLSKKGYKKFYLIGHSTGANKICVYNNFRPRNRISKYVLLGPGDDTGLYYNKVGRSTFKKALAKCKEEIRKGNRKKFATKYISAGFLITYESLYDMINPDGHYNTFPYLEYLEDLKLAKKRLFKEYKSIKKPTMIMFGSEEEYVYRRLPEVIEILKKETTAPSQFVFETIKGADHGFHGHEKKAASVVADWLLEK